MLRLLPAAVLGGVMSTTPLASQTEVREFVGSWFSPVFGPTFATVGDVDGDGNPDFLLGEQFDQPNGFGSGSASVLSGADGRIIHRILGQTFNDSLGLLVEGTGDTNGDGVPDFAILVPNRATAGLFSPRISVVQLHSGLDGSLLHDLIPARPEAGITALARAGDVDSDGFADVILGQNSDQGLTGSATVFSGRDGTILHQISGPSPSARAGTDVCGAGDVNDDGFDDFAVANLGPVNQTQRPFGQIDVFSGLDGTLLRSLPANLTGGSLGESVANAGDLDGDGIDDLVIGSEESFTQPLDCVAVSGASGSVLWTAVLVGKASAAGDVNGDGIRDVIAGTPMHYSPLSSVGQVTILSGLDGTVLRSLNGPEEGRGYGEQVGSAGDLNGDGLPEFWLIGRNETGRVVTFAYDGDFTTTPGIIERRGAACIGNDNRLPSIEATAPPRIDDDLVIRLRSAPPQRASGLMLGTPWTIDLTPFGAPGCTSLVEPLITLVGRTDSSGRAIERLPIPNDTALIGAQVSTQWKILDPGTNALPLVASAALDLTIGG